MQSLTLLLLGQGLIWANALSCLCLSTALGLRSGACSATQSGNVLSILSFLGPKAVSCRSAPAWCRQDSPKGRICLGAALLQGRGTRQE